MAVIIALLAFGLLWKLWRTRLDGWRDGFLAASTTWGVILVAMTESLSIANRIVFVWVMTGWIVVDAVLLVALWRQHRSRKNSRTQEDSDEPGVKYVADSALAWVMLTPLAVIGATLAVVAFRGPPNNYDAMVYHMPRILHWIQDGNVAFYPTAIARQLDMPPAAEYIILHLQILTGDDDLADFVQWFAWCGCIIGVSAIAGLLGADVVGQVIAAVVAGTLPMACLQAVTTQNDLVAAFWIVALAWAVLRTLVGARRDQRDMQWVNILFCAGTLGMAMLTKTTNYLFAAPAVVALLLGLMWLRTWRAVAPLAVVAILAVALNAPMYVRNMRFTHTLIGTGGSGARGADEYINSQRTVGTIASNLLRNIGVELILPSDDYTGRIEQAIRAVHGWLGLDADNPATTLQRTPAIFQLRSLLWNTEDAAPNPVQLLLIFLAAVLILVHCRASGKAAIYGLGILAAAMAFCYELRWQPWHARLHLPIMITAAPLVGIALERHMNRKLALVIAALLPWLSVPVVLTNYSHPLVGDNSIFLHDHDTRLFVAHPNLLYWFREATKVADAHHCRQIGIIDGGDDWEYPLDMMVAEKLPGVRFAFYPGQTTLTQEQVQTRNKGWDETLRPYIVVKVSGDVATVVKIVDQ